MAPTAAPSRPQSSLRGGTRARITTGTGASENASCCFSHSGGPIEHRYTSHPSLNNLIVRGQGQTGQSSSFANTTKDGIKRKDKVDSHMLITEPERLVVESDKRDNQIV